MSVTLPATGTVVATETVSGAEQQIVRVSSMPAVALDAAALAALELAATPATQAVSGPLTDAQLRAESVTVNTLGQPGVARKLAAASSAGASTNVALTPAVRRISIVATSSAMRYAIGTGAQVASSNSHYIQASERLDLAVPASAQIAVISDTTTAGTLEITELL